MGSTSSAVSCVFRRLSLLSSARGCRRCCTGSGICPGCKKLLHMTFNEERKEMNLERFKDYQKRHGKECEANAKTDGKGSGI